ncbi:hypothetical protein BDZ94DRAFT_1160892 [Collybia nuda]|uniref:Protein FAM72A n=1 Tax=Collybia nuda TaxID=64659 RepID=A0A9P6CGA7_9AGAR|nr:hypothetical protein BDZ94DRAFT_1160892 [Collybia nuda]
MLAYLAQRPAYTQYPTNPYPSTPPPPPIPHKVWILDCKSCRTFLTNRGMKAVLLLRPNISLYSSDALPVNCSAYTSNPDALRPRISCRPSTSTSHIPPRTCECLTQTMCCHGCGATVGYMIVIPCVRCTSSITATNRATNGHRFVFHSSEIVGTERHYIIDEPGVIPYDPVPSTLSPHAPPFIPPPFYASYIDARYQDYDSLRSQPPSPSHYTDYLPTPPLELADPLLASANRVTDSFPFPRGHAHVSSEPYDLSTHTPGPFSQHHHPYPHPRSLSPSVPPHYAYHPLSRPTSAGSTQSRDSSPPLAHQSSPFSLPAEQKDQLPSRKLSPGDILYWHHLARNGEIPGVEDDERARGEIPPASADEKFPINFDR